MNKSELIAAMSAKNELSKINNEKALIAFMNVIKEELAKGNKISIVNFGTFEVTERAARKGRNPKTSEEIFLPASKAPKFKAGKEFKNIVNS